MLIIPFKQEASWEMQITLTNVIYLFIFKWNALNKYWVMNIYDRNRIPLLLGVKVVTNYDLTAQFTISGLPAGDILCQNVLGFWNQIERFDMGETNELFYYAPSELTTIKVNAIAAQEIA